MSRIKRFLRVLLGLPRFKTMATRYPVCPHCGHEDITVDQYSDWGNRETVMACEVCLELYDEYNEVRYTTRKSGLKGVWGSDGVCELVVREEV